MKRPWNLVDSPIYCFGVKRGARINYNICNYVMPISRKPKLYAVALEHDSLTWKLMLKSKQAWLQVLREPHASLIKPLGQRSGLKFDKSKYLTQKDWLTEWEGMPVLKECCAWLALNKLKRHVYGDHDLFIFEVAKWKSLNDQNLLTFNRLKELGLIL